MATSVKFLFVEWPSKVRFSGEPGQGGLGGVGDGGLDSDLGVETRTDVDPDKFSVGKVQIMLD